MFSIHQLLHTADGNVLYTSHLFMNALLAADVRIGVVGFFTTTSSVHVISDVGLAITADLTGDIHHVSATALGDTLGAHVDVAMTADLAVTVINVQSAAAYIAPASGYTAHPELNMFMIISHPMNTAFVGLGVVCIVSTAAFHMGHPLEKLSATTHEVMGVVPLAALRLPGLEPTGLVTGLLVGVIGLLVATVHCLGSWWDDGHSTSTTPMGV